MAQQQSTSFVDERAGDFWINALLGGVATVFLSWLPFSPVLGGALAGYLHQRSRGAGAKVGAASGIIAAIPIFFILLLVFGFAGISALASGSAVGAIVMIVIVVGGVFVAAVISGGLGAVGGYVGAMVQEDSDDGAQSYQQGPPGQGQAQGHGQPVPGNQQANARQGPAGQGQSRQESQQYQSNTGGQNDSQWNE